MAKQVLSGLIKGPGPNNEIIAGYDAAGNKTVKPLTFLGGTVISFNATLGIGPLEESSLTVELINDCFAGLNPGQIGIAPEGEYFLGKIKIGAPVFFDLGEATAEEATRPQFEARVSQEKLDNKTPSYFKFGGILQSYTAKQNSSGLTFDARVIDPRSLLSGVNIVVSNTLSGPIKHRNYYNVYAYYEYGVLKPDRRNGINQDLTIPGTIETDGPVDINAAHPELGRDVYSDKVDCKIYGSSSSDDRGMLYSQIIKALREMDVFVYSPNYAESFDPPLDGPDLASATSEGILKHQGNVFRIDLSELPVAPPYYRIPGPNISLLELINQVCEATGHLFHVYLEESDDPNKLHTIKIEVADIKKLVLKQNLESEILAYNGRSTDLSYGKELATENTRTLMLGNQKHEMYESINIEPFFGEDKYGEPIVPKSGTIEKCGWSIEVYLDELNSSLRCPLYDHDPDPDTVITRKVELSEFHIRLAMSGFEIWKKWVLNPLNTEDAASVVRRNFPSLSTDMYTSLYASLNNVQANGLAPGLPPGYTEEASNRSLADQLSNWNAKMLQAQESKQRESLEKVHNFFSSLGRNFYGKQYLASVSKDMCVTKANYVDLTYLDADGVEVRRDVTFYQDPCVKGSNDYTSIDNRLWQPRIYTHIPTNDGAWIEDCGAVLGLGDTDDERSYLSFFRTEDSRIGPVARFDSKTLAKLFRTEGLIDDRLVTFAGTPVVASKSQGVFAFGEVPSDQDIQELLFTSGLCGDLEIRNWSPDNYITIRESGYCPPPATGNALTDFVDLPATVWSKCSVGEKVYLDEDACITYHDVNYVPTPSPDECCGKWQIWNPFASCWWNFLTQGPIPEEDCFTYTPETVEKTQCGGVVKVPISFDEGCYTRYCDDANTLEMLAAEMDAFLGTFVSGVNQGQAAYDPDSNKALIKNGALIQTTERFCFEPKPTGILAIASALDFNSLTNQKIHSTAYIPTAVAIPLRSNIETYGPWKSDNFETSSGGIELIHDEDMCPWVFNGTAKMNAFATDVIADRSFNKTEIETGSITIPTFPDKSLGFIENGPNLTNINVSMGSNGVTTIYNYRTYTPKFGGIKNLEKETLKKNLALTNRIKKITQDKDRQANTIQRKLTGGGTYVPPDLNPSLTDRGTLHRVLVGQTYPFSILYDEVYESGVDSSGNPIGDASYPITGTGERTVVGTETLEKSVLELRYDYRKKAFMSWDGLISPVANIGTSGVSLPIYSKYNQTDTGARSIYNSPNPPIKHSGTDVYNIKIDREYLDPLTNPFPSGKHHHVGGGAGHNVDIVGRGAEAPEGGAIMNFYPQKDWEKRYSDEYRFLGLKGPIVLHQWGYDTQGKPIPNAIDDLELIQKSGVFRTQIGDGDPVTSTGLTDYFMEDWLQKPTSWPVAPVDLRYDRQRGVWVSPPDYKIVVVEAGDTIAPYATGSGYLINEKADKKYNTEIYDKNGQNIKADTTEASIVIEDRIGRNIKPGEKSYAYFDSFTSTYLLMGGGGGGSIRIGKFCNQWPSLSNVKNPANAVKEVVMYQKAADCSSYGGGTSCPWALEPVLIDRSGVKVPETVEAINLFANVPAHEYQTKWCAVVDNGGIYYLLAAEG